MRKITAIIPARGGSKGIPRKNIRLLAGKPLINHTIEQAKGSGFIDTIVVTTDDLEIARIAEGQGVTVVIRPEEISGDESPTIDAVIHVLEQSEKNGTAHDDIILLQPTSPLRDAGDIDAAITLFCEGNCDSVISVTSVSHPPFWNLIIKNSYLIPLFDEENLPKRRQDLPRTYLPNGAIYIMSAELIQKCRSFFGKKSIPYFMSPEKSIDIDTEIDFIIAESILNRS